MIRPSMLLLLLTAALEPAISVRAQSPTVVWQVPVSGLESTTIGPGSPGVLVSGFFYDTLVVDQQVFVNEGGLSAIFVGLLDEAGTLEWAKVFRQDGIAKAGGAVAGEDGSLYVAGGFQDTLWIDGSGYASRNLADYFIARFDGTDLQWIAQGDTVHNFHSRGSWVHSMDLDGGYLFVLGENMKEQVFEKRGVFLARYSVNGVLSWGVRLNRQISLRPGPEAVLADGEGGAYVAVRTYSAEIEVGDSIYTTPYPWLIDRESLALLRFDSDGLLHWVRILTGRHLGSAHLASRSAGGLYLADAHWDTLYMDHEVVLPPAGKASQAFLMAVDEEGEAVWTRTPPDSVLGRWFPETYSAGLYEDGGGAIHHFFISPGGVNFPENDEGMPLSASSFRTSFSSDGVVESFTGLPSYDISSSGLQTVSADSEGHVYAVVGQGIARLNLSGNATGREAPTETSGHDVAHVYPNPVTTFGTIVYHLPGPARTRVSLYDVLGREGRVLGDGFKPAGRHEITISAEGLPAGFYFVRVATPAGSAAVPVVVAR